LWTEEPNVPRLESDGRLVSRIRSYKLGWGICWRRRPA